MHNVTWYATEREREREREREGEIHTLTPLFVSTGFKIYR